MNGIQSSRARNLEKPFPGCLGRMVNLFDLSTGVAGNSLLTDKPHRDGFPLSRSQSDVSRMSPIGDQIEDKVIVSEMRRTSCNRKSDGTPIKMLIAQEMLKESGSTHNPSSVVAKLMGLDDLPQQQPNSASHRSHPRSYLQSRSDISLGHWQQLQHEIHHYSEQNEYNDVYEIWQKSPKTNYARDKSPQKGRSTESADEKKMDLVRQKFVEAKRLATDEKLRNSKQFQDALEVLSSNRDLFLKFLQEPNSLFSQHLYNFQSIPSPPPQEAKRITVLRPSKIVDNSRFAASTKSNEKQIKKTSLDDNHTQPTRIVVLKPCSGKPHEVKAIDSPPSSTLRTVRGGEFHEEREDDKARESREVAQGITRKMRQNLIGHRTDETLLSSVCSNGYIGDESSFSKSEIECEADNLSDSDAMSPASRHSWTYINNINKFNSPYSSPSLSRASYSPESSVCREAKKRLSERWSMMASTGGCQEQRRVRRSSRTLGEMLALSDTKKSVRSEEDGCNKEERSRGSTSCLIRDLNQVEDMGNSPTNLLRSKSVPVSSTVFGALLNVDVSDPEVRQTETTKARSMKSSFKGKVSNLFFSKNRKSTKDKSNPSNDESQSVVMPVHFPGKIDDDRLHCRASSQNSISVGPNKVVKFHEAGFSETKSSVCANPSENQEQPSPISVLEPPFEEDDHIAPPIGSNRQGLGFHAHPIQSNLIDKSPPIGSIARTLSWDNSCVETATSSYPLKPVPMGAKKEEQELFFLVQSLLSAAGLDGEVHLDSFLDQWHSPEIPLGPSLREKYVGLNDKEMVYEARRRQQRSTRKLVFDCVNAALVDMAGGYGCCGPRVGLKEDRSIIMVEWVWARMKEWVCGEIRCVWGDDGDHNSLDVERVVRNEVVGRGWVEDLRMEMDNLGKEIEGKLLEDLLQEAVIELTGRG